MMGRTALGAAKLYGQEDTEKALLKLGAGESHCGVYESPKTVTGKRIVINYNGATFTDSTGVEDAAIMEDGHEVEGTFYLHFTSPNGGKVHGKTMDETGASSFSGATFSIR